MCLIIQTFNEIVPQLDNIKSLVKDIKDEDLRRFLITLFIKLSGVNFVYEINRRLCNFKVDSNLKKEMKTFKCLILYSMFSSSNSSDYDMMIFTLSISGKSLFLPDSNYQELRDLMNKLISTDETSKIILKSFSSFIFTNVSSLYIIDQTFYDKLMELKHEVGIYGLFKKNILIAKLEADYSTKCINDEFIESIKPYISSLFQYIQYVFNDDSICFSLCQSLLCHILCFSSKNLNFMLMIEEELIMVNNSIYERIKKIPGVIECDNSFLIENRDLYRREFQLNPNILIIQIQFL